MDYSCVDTNRILICYSGNIASKNNTLLKLETRKGQYAPVFSQKLY